MVSLFGRGFDSLQFHHPPKHRPLILSELAAFFMPSVPNFGLFWGRIWGRCWPIIEPYYVKYFLFIDNFELIKKLKSEVLACFFPFYSLFLSILSFTCFYMELHVKVVFQLGMKKQPLMMDMQVTDIGKLLDFLELIIRRTTKFSSKNFISGSGPRIKFFDRRDRSHLLSGPDPSTKSRIIIGKIFGTFGISPYLCNRKSQY